MKRTVSAGTRPTRLAMLAAACWMIATVSGCVVLGFPGAEVECTTDCSARLDRIETRLSLIEESLGEPSIVQDADEEIPVIEAEPSSP